MDHGPWTMVPRVRGDVPLRKKYGVPLKKKSKRLMGSPKLLSQTFYGVTLRQKYGGLGGGIHESTETLVSEVDLDSEAFCFSVASGYISLGFDFGDCNGSKLSAEVGFEVLCTMLRIS